MSKDIEKLLKRKYDEIVVPDYMFDTSKVFERVEKLRKKRTITVLSLVLIFAFLVLLFCILVIA